MAATYETPTRYGQTTLEPAEPATSVSIIDPHSHFNGHYRTARDLRVEGSVEGEIECEGTLTVAPNAKLEAKVQARNVIIAGAASGEIVCREQFTLKPTGEMRGQVRAASLAVEEGAFFDGEFQMAETPAVAAVEQRVQRDVKPDKRDNKPTHVLPEPAAPKPQQIPVATTAEVVTEPVKTTAEVVTEPAKTTADIPADKAKPDSDPRSKTNARP